MLCALLLRWNPDLSLPTDILIWALLAGSTGLALARQWRAGALLLVLCLLAALLMERLTPFALSLVAGGLALACGLHRLPEPYRPAARALVLIWALSLMLHQIPGFDNLKVLDKVLTGPASQPFTLYLNLDKPLALFGLLLAWRDLLGSGGKIRWRPLLLLTLPLAGLLLAAWGLGALKPEVGLPNWWWLFALNNLLLTCASEEALFRGCLQQRLSERFTPLTGLLVASGLFGVAHLAGGPLLVGFAALAGVCYGLAFNLSGRLSVAIAIHFLFNFAHLALFTYPLASR
ncbi:CPBP family intramembrane glutamic endopeptidase [Aeromonas molluscorum]|uniref:CPBP family intramembrane glutamic endopeptidase n=1 Tax=Aeromonas molluscorum TaxID=271417 RepID=UPI003F1B19E7